MSHTLTFVILLPLLFCIYLSIPFFSIKIAPYWIFNFSTDSSIDLDCSLENDDANYLLQQSTTLQLPAQHQGKVTSGNNNTLDKPFGMDLSVEFGGQSNRSSMVSPQVMKFNNLSIVRNNFKMFSYRIHHPI